ncbi:hypothetical protein GGI12_005564 [Dipsacomyces acuminosporus]|nr:hypothetical protein GGI12_005564 [Dipsacomyces acuminosporus]
MNLLNIFALVLSLVVLVFAVDDYPYKRQCGQVDPWNYYKCQGTSFVAFRINKKLGIKFHNHYKGVFWTNANTWDDAARKTHVTINSTPKVNAVAQTDKGSVGQVAWVTKVSGDKVTVEEYNGSVRQKYSTKTVSKSYYKNYIHFK